MKTTRDLLRDSDPLSYEPALGDEDRERLRRAMWAGASSENTSQSAWPHRLVAAAVVMLVLVGGVVGSRLWQESVALQAQVRFEVRLADERPGDGLIEARVGGSEQVIYLHPEIIVTNGDIAQSGVVPGNNPSKFWIDVEFTAAGAERMRQATAEHIGRPIAILIDGAVAAAPRLRSPLAAAAVIISGDFGQDEAQAIADGIRGR